MIVTNYPHRLYSFIGSKSLGSIFNYYKKNGYNSYVEFPGKFSNSQLCILKKSLELPTKFSLTTQVGIYSGKFSFGPRNSGESVVLEIELANYREIPIQMVYTEFHYILL